MIILPYEIRDIVQFNPKHKWYGCLGIISNVENIYKLDSGSWENDYKYTIDVVETNEIVRQCVVTHSDECFFKVGKAIFPVGEY